MGDMSETRQLALFKMPVPVKLTHDWRVRPVGPNECDACQLLWFSGASRAETVTFLTEDCPVKLLNSRRRVPGIRYLI
jgi:hypothetical protein